MTDITMCRNEECPLKATCKRNPASGTKQNPIYQAWMDFNPKNCIYFRPIDKPKIIA